MKFRLIEAEKAEHPISRLCKVLGVTRQGFDAWRRRGPSLRQLGDDELKQLIVTIYDGSHQTYGAVRINDELREEHDVHVGRKRVARLMRELAIQGVSRRGKKPRTTIADEKAPPPAPDLVERRFAANRPNALWLADITYVETLEGYLFLAVVMDMFSRKIVGWSMRDDLKAELVVDALAMAVTRRRPPAGLVHHSDRGSQYTSLVFGRTLRESGLLQSVGRRGHAGDNAACESCISTLKVEWIKRHRYQSRDQARLSIFRFIETFYNPRRRHSGLGGISPDEYENRCQKRLKQQELDTIATTRAA
jgi:putative transposase